MAVSSFIPLVEYDWAIPADGRKKRARRRNPFFIKEINLRIKN
jgi:hypothetical protein